MGNETSKTGGSTSAMATNTRNSNGGSGALANPAATSTRTAVAVSPAQKSPSLSAPQQKPQRRSLATPSLQRSSAPLAVSSNAAVPPTSQLSNQSPKNNMSSVGIPTSTALSGSVDAMGSSVPRYVDANSVVYTLPSFTLETASSSVRKNNAKAHSDGGGPACSQAGMASAPMPLALPVSGSDLRAGAPSSPLSSSRRHFPLGSISSPIAIPTYNTMATTAAEELSCSSPMLRSYRQHSFSAPKWDPHFAKSPTSSLATYFNPSSFNASASELPPAIASSPTSASLGTAIHTKFLEITGHPLGLENYGNTCYCNSVIQLIYHCTPLRLRLLELHDVYQLRKGKPGFEEDTVLHQLCSLIATMHKSNNRSKEKYQRERISTKELLQCVRKKNEIFNNDMQQDAHEFTMFLINDITETEQRIMASPSNANLFLQQESAAKKKTSTFSFWKHSKDKTISANSQRVRRLDRSSTSSTADDSSKAKSVGAQPPWGGDLTPLQVILQGQFGSLTACLECENITARDEVFIDLSLETAQGCSLLRCLDHFGDPEYFWGNNKLRCDVCKTQVRAAKTIHVQQLPQYALLIHLKRFQYDVKKQNFTKKSDHVALPMQMDVEEYLTDPEVIEKNRRNEQARSQNDNTSTSTGKNEGGSSVSGAASGKPNSPAIFKPASEEVRGKLRGVARHKARFELTGFVAHIGEGPNSGHYFTCVRYGPQLWRRFDDDTVSIMAERDVQQYFGVPSDATGVVTTTAYILLYERVA
ncbi:putative ubiquitin hydrolase putative cysteine peptidase Clan CA family C19 [Leptomonas seymouri]|uniref:Ubiquitin carboxyl-terminal hydrolase n=1 Tax=Leptomonas seymouri TaxID=5684 RepID=A0A0N0P852_LEPSE|nr:putative ubiquitin hydrolase putative cysteine peptidase Clan CA family C19 [Leptomonas seymouri]|eukprot:KPI89546.1 putative ubiquitin hydrolase putative cysteine peptidase Clan CA family C19 [Leptomonas seymouri]